MRVAKAKGKLRGKQEHPRSRVWEEERHGRLPGWSVRPIYRLLIPPIRFLSARGRRRAVAPE
jgi:hypothetical protein